MADPAEFAVIRNGQTSVYGDRWSSIFLFREILWGPEAFEEWLAAGEKYDDDEGLDEFEGGAVLNFDTRELTWFQGHETFDVPCVGTVYQKLLAAAWPGYTVTEAKSPGVLARAAGTDWPDDADEYGEDAWMDRPENVQESTSDYDGEEDLDEDDDDEDDDFTPRAWITLIDNGESFRHRILYQVSQDLINGDESAFEQLRKLNAAEVPPEVRVSEGMWIDASNQEIGFWGNYESERALSRLQQSWDGWTVRWAANGYRDQCQATGIPGEPMSDAEALGKIVPQLLSTKRFDVGAIMGAIGGQLKGAALKACGCLIFILAIPILIFGYFMEQMRAAGITIGALVVVVAIAFKVVEGKFKQGISEGAMGGRGEEEGGRPAVAGPLDEDIRRSRLNELLASAGLPSIEEIEPHFPRDPQLQDLLGD